MFVDNRDDARKFFIEVRQKYLNNEALERLEGLILDVILSHPEYHELLDKGFEAIVGDYFPEQGTVNPFLHMGMHIAIKEQIQTDRPSGIRAECEALLIKYGDLHKMEHEVMNCLGESLWLAQRNSCMPDERAYLENIKALK
jgi:hypothetical protein